jgi:hypothetical protein
MIPTPAPLERAGLSAESKSVAEGGDACKGEEPIVKEDDEEVEDEDEDD